VYKAKAGILQNGFVRADAAKMPPEAWYLMYMKPWQCWHPELAMVRKWEFVFSDRSLSSHFCVFMQAGEVHTSSSTNVFQRLNQHSNGINCNGQINGLLLQLKFLGSFVIRFS
jgi:hypothetical protein